MASDYYCCTIYPVLALCFKPNTHKTQPALMKVLLYPLQYTNLSIINPHAGRTCRNIVSDLIINVNRWLLPCHKFLSRQDKCEAGISLLTHPIHNCPE